MVIGVPRILGRLVKNGRSIWSMCLVLEEKLPAMRIEVGSAADAQSGSASTAAASRVEVKRFFIMDLLELKSGSESVQPAVHADILRRGTQNHLAVIGFEAQRLLCRTRGLLAAGGHQLTHLGA